MDKDTRNAIERATQRARKLLEQDFSAQLAGDFDVQRDGAVAPKAGGHLSPRQAFFSPSVFPEGAIFCVRSFVLTAWRRSR